MDPSRNAVTAWPRRIRVQRFSGPRDMIQSALWCAGGLALIAALLCLVFAAFELAAMLLAIPLLLVAFGLFIVAGFCVLGAPLLWIAQHLVRFGSGSLHVEHGLVLAEGGIPNVVPLSAVTFASLSPLEDELTLRTREGDVIQAKVSGDDEALALVEAIAVSKVHGTWLATLYRRAPAARWVQVRWLGAVIAALLASVVLLPFVSVNVAIALGVLVGGAVHAGASRAKKPDILGSVVLGTDGLALKYATSERFIAFGSIARVDETEAGAQLSLLDGEVVDVDVVPLVPVDAKAPGTLTATLSAQRRAQLLQLVREGLRAERGESDRAGALLERRGRTVRAWREGLLELMREAGGGYRTATLPREQAFAVLEDGHAPGELRIGAALALSTGGRAGEHATPRGLDADTVVRLRIAVETCVNQDVRTALRDAIYGELEEETLERATTPRRATL
jgi:hypothetical protein